MSKAVCLSLSFFLVGWLTYFLTITLPLLEGWFVIRNDVCFDCTFLAGRVWSFVRQKDDPDLFHQRCLRRCASGGSFVNESKIKVIFKVENCTSTCEETPCLIGHYFWSSTLCENMTFFWLQLLGAIVICLGTFYVLYQSSQDLRQSSSRSSSSSDDGDKPLSYRNSFYCPLCASRWKYLSCIFRWFDYSNPLEIRQTLSKPKGGKWEPLRTNLMTLEEQRKATKKFLRNWRSVTDSDLRYCPFHKYRDFVQFYGCFTLFVTSIWFFIWPLPHPVRLFTAYFVCFFLSVYLPFLFLLCLFRQKVEYDKNFPTTQQLGDHFSPDLMERNVETVLKYLPFDADDEIISVGRPCFAKESTRSYYSPWLGIPLVFYGTIYCVTSWILVILKAWDFGFYVYFGFFMVFVLQMFLPLLAESCVTTSFTILVVCSKSLKFIAFESSAVSVCSVEEPAAELSGQIFLVDHTTSSNKISLLHCNKADACGRKKGDFQLGKDQFFEFDQFHSRIVSYQFSDPEVMTKFQKLPWFHLNVVSEENLPEPSAHSSRLSIPFLMWVFGILSIVAIFFLVVYNLFTAPSIAVLWYFLVHVEMGYLSTLSVWGSECDEPLPVWSHYILFQSTETLESSHGLVFRVY